MEKIIVLLLLLIRLTAFAQVREDTIALPLPGGSLYGSLFMPEGKIPFPLLVIIPGSGPTDRYGNNPMGLHTNSYKMMATALAGKKIAVFLLDKRGVAKSIGAIKKEADLRFDDYVNDVVDWLQLLQKDKRIKNVFIAGHSEGSLVGMLAAQKIKVHGFISIAGPAKGIAEIITEQYASQLPKAAPVVDSLFKRLYNNLSIDTVPPYLLSIFRPSVQPYIKSWMKYIPCEEIKKLHTPVMIIQGGHDLQVNPNEASLLKSCKPAATFLLLDSMNHILKNAPLTRVENMATYSMQALPLSGSLSDAIAAFIEKNN